MLKVAIFGASGIIGQHMRLACPASVKPIYVRRHADMLHVGLDLTDRAARESFLERERPDVIVNLAGESNTDAVEQDPGRYREINVNIPLQLAEWCDLNGAHVVHVSTQAVFDGYAEPYSPEAPMGIPVNKYGFQKMSAELGQYQSRTIVRPTFVLGIRPLPHVGRANPLEQMLSGQQKQQVNDRWFSVSFARDVAAALWEAAINRPGGIIHVGLPDRVSRYDIACKVARNVEPVPHDSFPGIAPRPIDTTYAGEPVPGGLEAGLWQCASEWAERKLMTIEARAREIALFLGKTENECYAKLSMGFGPLHNEVTADWNQANPQTDEEITEWYRRTESYIWELSAYHADLGFNYAGTCRGISERLKASGAKRVLCLGDGIGDLTISLIQAGFDAVYHDLAGSRTADFAQFRAWATLGKYMPARTTYDFNPQWGDVGGYRVSEVDEYDAIVSLDFLEHVANVEEWALAIKMALKPGGLFVAQNGFAIGSGPAGSMPMHLAINDRFEKEWDPTLAALGFEQLSSNWYQVPAEVAVAV